MTAYAYAVKAQGAILRPAKVVLPETNHDGKPFTLNKG